MMPVEIFVNISAPLKESDVLLSNAAIAN